MKRIWLFYCECVQVQVLAVVIPYTAYVVAWFVHSLTLAEWSFYGICITVTAILVAAFKHRLAKNGKKARSSLDAFCIMFLLAFITVLVLSPLSFRRE